MNAALKEQSISLEQLKSLMSYDPITGKFVRLKTVNNRAIKGSEPGWNHNAGYRSISVNSKTFLAHRLAWFYMTGEWPIEVDHKNRNRRDNRWGNLRNSTHQQNAQNVAKDKTFKKSTTLSGACWDKSTNNWKSSICINGRQKHLGRFGTDLEAHDAYVSAKREYHAGNLL